VFPGWPCFRSWAQPAAAVAVGTRGSSCSPQSEQRSRLPVNKSPARGALGVAGFAAGGDRGVRCARPPAEHRWFVRLCVWGDWKGSRGRDASLRLRRRGDGARAASLVRCWCGLVANYSRSFKEQKKPSRTSNNGLVVRPELGARSPLSDGGVEIRRLAVKTPMGTNAVSEPWGFRGGGPTELLYPEPRAGLWGGFVPALPRSGAAPRTSRRRAALPANAASHSARGVPASAQRGPWSRPPASTPSSSPQSCPHRPLPAAAVAPLRSTRAPREGCAVVVCFFRLCVRHIQTLLLAAQRVGAGTPGPAEDIPGRQLPGGRLGGGQGVCWGASPCDGGLGGDERSSGGAAGVVCGRRHSGAWPRVGSNSLLPGRILISFLCRCYFNLLFSHI